MNMQDFFKWLSDEEIIYHTDRELKDYTTLHIGGKAAAIVEPNSIEKLCKVIKVIHEKELKFFILGNGSNVLFEDEGYDGIIVHITNALNKIELLDENQVRVQSGATNAELARFTQENSLTGYEFACGIPGTIGGAIYMNAGAYDGETKEVVRSVRYIDQAGKIKTIDHENLQFGYRHSYFTENFGLILDVTYQFEIGEETKIKTKIEELMSRRYEKQPMDKYSAGSTFKRPAGYYASKLIQDTGLRGYAVGDACVSSKHTGFLINDGKATSKQFQALIKDVQDKVNAKYGVMLECEIKHIK